MHILQQKQQRLQSIVFLWLRSEKINHMSVKTQITNHKFSERQQAWKFDNTIEHFQNCDTAIYSLENDIIRLCYPWKREFVEYNLICSFYDLFLVDVVLTKKRQWIRHVRHFRTDLEGADAKQKVAVTYSCSHETRATNARVDLRSSLVIFQHLKRNLLRLKKFILPF